MSSMYFLPCDNIWCEVVMSVHPSLIAHCCVLWFLATLDVCCSLFKSLLIFWLFCNTLFTVVSHCMFLQSVECDMHDAECQTVPI